MRSRLSQRHLFFYVLILSAAATFVVCAVGANDDAFRSSGASWSPDSSKVAFILPGQNGMDRLYTANSDGSDVQPIFEGKRFQAVAWAPNGAHLAVASAPVGAEAVVHVMDAGAMSREAVKLGCTASNVALGWSTDSTRIVVQTDLSILLLRLKDKTVESLDNAKPAVARVFFNGTSPLSLDNKLLLAAGPVGLLSWTFGYRPVPISQADVQGDLSAWLVKVEGKRHTLPVMQYGSLAGPPVWAPNGKAIAFMTKTPPETPVKSRPIPRFWMNMVSEVGTLLIDPIQIMNPISTTPVWSPAGTDIAYFWRDPTGKSLLNVVNTAFSTVIPLQKRMKRVLFAAWNEPASVFFIATTTDDETVCSTLNLISGELRRSSTLSTPFRHLVASPDLTKLLLATKQGERPMFEVYDISTGNTVRLIR